MLLARLCKVKRGGETAPLHSRIICLLAENLIRLLNPLLQNFFELLCPSQLRAASMR